MEALAAGLADLLESAVAVAPTAPSPPASQAATAASAASSDSPPTTKATKAKEERAAEAAVSMYSRIHRNGQAMVTKRFGLGGRDMAERYARVLARQVTCAHERTGECAV